MEKLELVEEPKAFRSLSDKQKDFCREYVIDWNGTRAYGKVFGGKNSNTIKSSASNLIRQKRIQLYCDYLNDNLELVTGVSRSWVMQQHLKIVNSSIAHLHDSWIDLTDFKKLTPAQKDCIEEITTQTRREVAESEDGDYDVQVDYVKLKLYNKQKALDAITRMMGYDKAQRVDITSGGKVIGMGTTVNVQVNIYNCAPPLASSEKEIKG